MRIVTCITRLIRGGAQRVALETAARLTVLGHDAPIWCGPETGPEGSLHEEAAARGVHVRIFPPLVRAVRPIRDLDATRALAAALREDPPDWFHTHSSKAGIVGREAGRRAGLKRIVHTVHGWGFAPGTAAPLSRLFVLLERRAGRQGRLVFVNPADRAEGCRLGIPGSEHGPLIPPGIDLTRFADRGELARRRAGIRAALDLPPDAFVGGFVGRLAPQKDPRMLLAVADSLRRETPHLHWVIVGDGPLAPELRSTASAEPALDAALHWVGLAEEPAPWLASMDFLLLPSLWEGAPLTLMEAMAAGLPVVASDLPGIRWLLEGAPDHLDLRAGGEPGPLDRRTGGEPDLLDRRTGGMPAGLTVGGSPVPPAAAADRTPGVLSRAGLLVPPGSRSGFVEAVRSLAHGEQTRLELGKRAREIAMARFGLEGMLARLLELYEQT